METWKKEMGKYQNICNYEKCEKYERYYINYRKNIIWGRQV